MKNLLQLLERFTKSLHKDTLAKEALSQIVADATRISLPPENFSLKDGVLSITASPSVKNEIRLKEETIKEALKRFRGVNVSRVLYK